MNKTYRGKTAGAILNTARIEVMRAGNAEIVVDLPGHSENCMANVGARPSGFGGERRDVMVLHNVEGVITRLSTTERSLGILLDWEAAREHKQKEENEKSEVTP